MSDSYQTMDYQYVTTTPAERNRVLRNTYALAVNGHTGLPQHPPKINHARREAQGESSATNHVAT